MLYKILTKKRFENFNFLFTVILLLLGQSCYASRILIRENGYENIVIGIEEQVKEDIKLLDNLKRAFTLASNFLFSITR